MTLRICKINLGASGKADEQGCSFCLTARAFLAEFALNK
jgi:hypothetical protein